MKNKSFLSSGGTPFNGGSLKYQYPVTYSVEEFITSIL